MVDSRSTRTQISWVVVFKGQKLWVYGLHAMFAFLLVFGVARAYVDDRLDARVIGLAITLAVVYAAQRWLPTARRWRLTQARWAKRAKRQK